MGQMRKVLGDWIDVEADPRKAKLLRRLREEMDEEKQSIRVLDEMGDMGWIMDREDPPVVKYTQDVHPAKRLLKDFTTRRVRVRSCLRRL